MTNYIASFILGTILVTGVLLGVGMQSSNASTEDLKVTIQRVAEDYRKEQGFNGQCYIGGIPVTLAQMLYGLGVAEGGFKLGSAGIRTNNPGSLHKEMGVKKAVDKQHIDGTKTRPVYASMYDGLYEKAHLVASPNYRYKCNFTFESAFAYTSGPNAKRTEDRKQNARNHLNNALRGAMAFSNTNVKNVGNTPKENLYLKAKSQEERTQKLLEQYTESKAKTEQYWSECVAEGITCAN